MYRREYYVKTADQQREKARKWAHDNPERKTERERARRQRLGDVLKRKVREWRERNLSRAREHAIARRARKHSAPGRHTTAEWESLKARYDYRCLCCGKREPEIKLTEDHIIPLGPNGPDSIDNIQPLCGPCNSSKGARRATDYRPK
jgi:5-methylcytosine-specific restriction endonuclease McrA